MSKRKPSTTTSLLWTQAIIEYNDVVYRGIVIGVSPTNSEQGVLVSFRDAAGAKHVVWRAVVNGKVVPV